jgi:hypothetical protein
VILAKILKFLNPLKTGPGAEDFRILVNIPHLQSKKPH